ncbi:hypothetical protein VTO42DRAFT_5382 [Malbranchea cinnamomea]
MPGSFDFNDPMPRTNIAPRSNEVSADFSEANIIEGKRQLKPSSRVLGIFNTTLQSAFNANLEPKKKAIHRSNLPPAPRTWKEMQRHKFQDHWYKAAGVEIEKLQECRTYKIVPIPYGKQIIPLMWVFTYKFDDKGFLLKFKARLVVWGDLVKNPSGKNTRSDTLAACTARVLIAIMTYFDLDARHYDSINTFLNSFLDPDEQFYSYKSTNIFRIWVPHLHRVFRSRDVRFDETRCYDPTEPHIAQQLHEYIEDFIETIHILEICTFNSLLLYKDDDFHIWPSQGEMTTETPTDSVRDTEAKRISATQEYLPTPEPTLEPMMKTVDVISTDSIDEPASVPGHADATYDASFDDIEGLDSSDFDPATQLALDLDTFMDTNPL